LSATDAQMQISIWGASINEAPQMIR